MRRTLFAILLIPFFAGCSGGGTARSMLGFEKKSPDEFMVISRPPLDVPPEFSLRPPGEGKSTSATELKVLDPSTYASAPTGQVTTEQAPTHGEAKLLEKTGTLADPGIRELLTQDAAPIEEAKEYGFFTKLLTGEFRKKDDPQVDARKEKERITQNKKEDKPLTEGETPTQAPRSVWDKLF